MVAGKQGINIKLPNSVPDMSTWTAVGQTVTRGRVSETLTFLNAPVETVLSRRHSLRTSDSDNFPVLNFNLSIHLRCNFLGHEVTITMVLPFAKGHERDQESFHRFDYPVARWVPSQNNFRIVHESPSNRRRVICPPEAGWVDVDSFA